MTAPLQHLRLTDLAVATASALEEVTSWLGGNPPPGAVVLDAADRPLNLPQLQAIQQRLAASGFQLQRLEASTPLSLVPAACLGLETQLRQPDPQTAALAAPGELSVHRGTLRSGDHLQVEGSLLVLGDVNPGARVSAGGDVRVWGRLRGIAHAGRGGDATARIVALQLRPLQLRIADAVARGPEEPPPPGLCEEALLVEGAIAIRPAEPQWPQLR